MDYQTLKTRQRLERHAHPPNLALRVHRDMAARKALAQHDTAGVLSIALSRLHTLRNQLMHGGATWNSSVNRDQIRDCGDLLGKLVPLVIEIMMAKMIPIPPRIDVRIFREFS